MTLADSSRLLVYPETARPPLLRRNEVDYIRKRYLVWDAAGRRLRRCGEHRGSGGLAIGLVATLPISANVYSPRRPVLHGGMQGITQHYRYSFIHFGHAGVVLPR